MPSLHRDSNSNAGRQSRQESRVKAAEPLRVKSEESRVKLIGVLSVLGRIMINLE